MKTVSIQGEINRPGIFELKSGESLKDLVKMAGGLKITAYLNRVQIDRIVPFEDRVKTGMDRVYTDVDLDIVLNNKNSFELLDGDNIQVFSILDLRKNGVSITGSVVRPGTYELVDSLRISDLIDKADGLLGDAYLERLDIIRIKPDFSERLIKLNLGLALEGDADNNILLQGLDEIRVYGKSEMVPKKTVSITGHVKNPGVFILKEDMTIYDLIFKSGGFVDEEFKNKTYLDRAELIRTVEQSVEKEIIPFRLDEVLAKEGIANLLLRPDDLIKIYSISEIEGELNFVSISGKVKRPGRYELFEKNMTLYDLLFKSGGFEDPNHRSETFLERADLLRLDSNRLTKSIKSFPLGDILDNKDHFANTVLKPGDEIRIYAKELFDTEYDVEINGSVKYPGTYKLKNKMVVKDLILEAGGVMENIFKYQVEIARIDPLNTDLNKFSNSIVFYMDEQFKISINERIDRSYNDTVSVNNFFLKPYDVISVRPDPYFGKQKIVQINGEVLYPGKYSINHSSEKISDIINRAGGVTVNAYLKASKYIRNGQNIKIDFDKIMKNKRSKLNFNVQDGDQIIINTSPNLVYINGEVNTTGIHKYVPGKRLRYYLGLSGGPTNDADLGNIWVEYPNGDSKRYKRYSLFSPKVIDGSIITIGKMKEEEPFDRTEYAKELTSIFANIAQVIAVIALASGTSN